MPHLSPMHWLFAITMFFFSLALLISNLWWHIMPKFPPLSLPKSSPSNPWSW